MSLSTEIIGNEVSFIRELAGSSLMNEAQRSQFYNTMKDVVVIVESVRNEGLDSEECWIGGGVIISNTPHILTASHIVPIEKGGVIVACRRFHEDSFSKCRVVKRDIGKDLAILELEKFQPSTPSTPRDRQWDFAVFGEPQSLIVGMELLSICHPSKLVFTLLFGELCLGYRNLVEASMQPTCRFVGEVVREEDKSLQDIEKDLPILQINNFHGTSGVSGAPVFDSRGMVVGICSFILKGYDFAIPVTVLKDFCQEVLHPQPPPPDRQRKRNRKRTK